MMLQWLTSTSTSFDPLSSHPSHRRGTSKAYIPPRPYLLNVPATAKWHSTTRTSQYQSTRDNHNSRISNVTKQYFYFSSTPSRADTVRLAAVLPSPRCSTASSTRQKSLVCVTANEGLRHPQMWLADREAELCRVTRWQGWEPGLRLGDREMLPRTRKLVM